MIGFDKAERRDYLPRAVVQEEITTYSCLPGPGTRTQIMPDFCSGRANLNRKGRVRWWSYQLWENPEG
jgi:hypothetical protein